MTRTAPAILQSTLAVVSIAVLAASCVRGAEGEEEVEGTASSSDAPQTTALSAQAGDTSETDEEWSQISDEQWHERLSPQAFHVLREAGTERAFSGALWDQKHPGMYVCAGCGLDLFSSATKFKSGTGWPSFWQPISAQDVASKTDHKLGYARTEVHCARCGGHLGHVFSDGPKPTGLRYCINSAALRFAPLADQEDSKDVSD